MAPSTMPPTNSDGTIRIPRTAIIGICLVVGALVVMLLVLLWLRAGRRCPGKAQWSGTSTALTAQPGDDPTIRQTHLEPTTDLNSDRSPVDIPRVFQDSETETLSTVIAFVADPPAGAAAAEGIPAPSSRRASTLVGTATDAPSPKLEGDGRALVNTSPLPDAEQMRQEALARMLAEDPAPTWHPRRRSRSRSRRRRAVDGGVQMNGNGPERTASPAPTTVSTLYTCESVSTLPPAYARYGRERDSGRMSEGAP